MGLVESRRSEKADESEGEEETGVFAGNYDGNFGVPTGTITDKIISFAKDGTDPGEELPSALKRSWSGKRRSGLRVTFGPGTLEGSSETSISEGPSMTLGFLDEGPVSVPEAQRRKWERRTWESLSKKQQDLLSRFSSPRGTYAPSPGQISMQGRKGRYFGRPDNPKFS